MPETIVDKALADVDSIGISTFSGGEPALNDRSCAILWRCA